MSLPDIIARIAQAEKDAGRPQGSVHLIAVSKVQPNERVRAVLAKTRFRKPPVNGLTSDKSFLA
jgi:uncharacterized pyridoxal phosphate-containing UPF0001 family protein